MIGASCQLFGMAPADVLTIDSIVGVALTPLALLLGVNYEDSGAVAMLLGQKTFLNEFVPSYLPICCPVSWHWPRSKC